MAKRIACTQDPPGNAGGITRAPEMESETADIGRFEGLGLRLFDNSKYIVRESRI